LSRTLRRGCLASILCILSLVACGDPNDPRTTIGTLTGVVRDADTDAPIDGVTLVVAGIQGQTGSDGRFSIDSIPVGTQQVTATTAGYVGQTIEVQIRGGEAKEITVELVADAGPPGPTGVAATTDEATPGTVRVSWEAVDGATSYVVYWGTHSPVDPERGTRIADAPNPFIHSELSAGTTYYYVVTAIRPEGESRPSAQVSARPDGPIAIEFVNPVPTQFVEAQFSVSVEITSVFQLSSVTAQVGEFTDDLTYAPASDEWSGFFDVADTPSPSFQTVHYTATDVAGNIARTAVLVRLDRLPEVTLSAPLDDALAAPSIRTTATCTDDAPGGCESLIISIDGSVDVEKVVAQSTVDQEISLAEFDGEVVELRAIGADALRPDTIPHATSKVRTVYVDASDHLTRVAGGGTGTLIDASATHLLTVDGFRFDGLDTDTLRLVDRGSGQSTVIHAVPREKARQGALFPGGVIFLTGETEETLREWRNGTPSVLATEVVSFKAKRPYAIWWTAQDGLIRRELTSGTNVSVPGAANTGNDVAITGEVAFWNSTPYEIFFFDGDMTTQLTNDGGGSIANSYPVTDGINVVYRRQALPAAPPDASIRLSDPGGEITLASHVTRGIGGLEPGEDYQVNDGWIAFVRPDAAGSLQVWRRSPAGVETQVSAFGSSSRIESMGPSGEIVFTSDATGTSRRYRAPVGGPPTDIGSALGRSIYIDGQLHVMMGSTLLRVD